MNDFAMRVLAGNSGKTCLFSVGQAGFIIKSKGGQLLGLDLYLSECVERVEGHVGFKRLQPHILDPEELVFDCLIATHSHLDHFDMDAIPTLISENRTKLYASVNCRQEMQRLRFAEDRAEYVKPGDHVVCGDFTLDFVPCDHGTGAPDAVGVVVTVDGKKIYFTGDTCLRLDRLEVYKAFGVFDVMAAPINGAYGNLNEQECADLSHALNPILTIPCHYGMFASHGGNPGRFMDIMNSQYPDNKYLLMAMGECYILN